MEKFTPGPWHVASCGNCLGFCVRSAEDVLLASVSICTTETRSESYANGKLMASAPKMLETLEECRDLFKELSMGEMFFKVDKVIKEARGDE